MNHIHIVHPRTLNRKQKIMGLTDTSRPWSPYLFFVTTSVIGITGTSLFPHIQHFWMFITAPHSSISRQITQQSHIYILYLCNTSWELIRVILKANFTGVYIYSPIRLVIRSLSWKMNRQGIVSWFSVWTREVQWGCLWKMTQKHECYSTVKRLNICQNFFYGNLKKLKSKNDIF